MLRTTDTLKKFKPVTLDFTVIGGSLGAGGIPPVDFRAVCFVRAIYIPKRWTHLLPVLHPTGISTSLHTITINLLATCKQFSVVKLCVFAGSSKKAET